MTASNLTCARRPPRIVAIVAAAGVGARACAPGVDAATPKQYRLLGGVPVLRRTVQVLLSDERIAQIRVAVAADDPRAAAATAGLPRTVCRPCGGPTRAATVLAALREVCATEDAAHSPDWILVHDAARPGLPSDALARLIDACLPDAVGGLLALPLADTLKHAAHGRARQTLVRDGLWLAQTPQLFRAPLLLTALQAAHAAPVSLAVVTDEASAIEAAGHAPLLVRGSPRNLKLTWPEDFDLMEKLL